MIRGASAVALLAVMLLVGCGQTGPLYLPDSGTVVTRPAKPPAAAPSAASTATPAGTPAPPPTPPATPDPPRP